MGGRPDFGRKQIQQRSVAEFVGETAMWRGYASSLSQGTLSEAAGVGASSYYAQRVVTGLFVHAHVPFVETYFPGGMVITGDVLATLVDCIPSTNDELIWRGANYRVVGSPIPQPIAGRSAYRMILRRGQGTP